MEATTGFESPAPRRPGHPDGAQMSAALGWGTDDLDDDADLIDPGSRDDHPDTLDRRLARRLHAALAKLEPDQQSPFAGLPDGLQ